MAELQPFNPETQIAFAERLADIERLHLHAALRESVGAMPVSEIDESLAAIVPPESLSRLASTGLRGETFFACPLLLRRNPRLLTYYRLLYGLSQKEFYGRGYGRFKSMEDRGALSTRADAALIELCEMLTATGSVLLDHLEDLSVARIRDLQLLTLGAQLRGSRLNEIGRAATHIVFNLIRGVVSDDKVLRETKTEVVLRNAAGRVVAVAFASDPDIAITEQLGSGERKLLAVEIKGGTDGSNYHNRLGEAEKSHQKAKAEGYVEFWTILNTDYREAVARRESPTTNQFFNLAEMLVRSSPEWPRFRAELTARINVA